MRRRMMINTKVTRWLRRLLSAVARTLFCALVSSCWCYSSATANISTMVIIQRKHWITDTTSSFLRELTVRLVHQSIKHQCSTLKGSSAIIFLIICQTIQAVHKTKVMRCRSASPSRVINDYFSFSLTFQFLSEDAGSEWCGCNLWRFELSVKPRDTW